MSIKNVILGLVLVSQTIQAQSGKFFLINTSGVSRQEDPLLLSRETLSNLMSLPPKESKKVPIVSINGKTQAVQLDDLNGDGVWDELAMMVDIERNSRLQVKIKWVEPEKAPFFEPRTRVWFGLSEKRDGKFKPVKYEVRPDWWTPQQQPPRYQMEGPGWENDKVAFRYYFDSRNGFDIFGKTTPKLVLDSVDGSFQDYHKLCPWGMDILKVGTSLGAGGFALIDQDRLVPLQKTHSAIFREIASGPIRSMIELQHEGWDVNGKTYNVRQRISLWAGKYWFKNEVLITGFLNEKEVAVGIVNLKNKGNPIQQSLNNDFLMLSSHARQSENDDMLGMGLLFNRKNFSGYGEAPALSPTPKSDTITSSWYGKIKIRSGEVFGYSFFAAWEKSDPKFANTHYFTELLQTEADRRQFPLKLSKK